MSLSKLIHFIFGSNILDKYEIPIGDDPYQENVAETMGDRMLMFARGFRHFCTVVSPVLIAMAYNRRWYEPACVMKFLQYIVIYYSIAYTTRTIGRICSEDYRKFTNVLMEVTESREPSPDAEAQLRNYDYEIFMAPIEYIAETRAGKKFVATDEKEFADMGPLWDLVKDPVSAFVVHTFGRRMLYPGATSLFKTLFAGVLKAGRRKLVKEHGGRRNVLLTEDGNCIDSMFVDNRHKSSTGSKLVVTCEGNAGFYEVGIANAPLAKGYSILGWNHPGFAQSSGLPYPDQEQNAVEAVMQFATKKLGFKESDIILYGWSIGGFTATWAAANYNVGSLLLDATFDDLLPLAIAKMPKPVDFVVQYAVRKYLNLPISKQLSMYNGPVRLIRRSDDDIIVTDEFGSAADRRASNRANQLLVDLIESRHPGLLRNESDRNIAKEWLALSPVERVSAPTDNITTLTRYRLYNGLEDKQRRELIFHYCDKYLVDFDAGHNMPLPEDYFNPPGPYAEPFELEMNRSAAIGSCGHHPSICARLRQERADADAHPDVYFVGYLYLALSVVAFVPALLILAVLLKPNFLKQPFYQLLAFLFVFVATNVLLTGLFASFYSLSHCDFSCGGMPTVGSLQVGSWSAFSTAAFLLLLNRFVALLSKKLTQTFFTGRRTLCWMFVATFFGAHMLIPFDGEPFYHYDSSEAIWNYELVPLGTKHLRFSLIHTVFLFCNVAMFFVVLYLSRTAKHPNHEKVQHAKLASSLALPASFLNAFYVVILTITPLPFALNVALMALIQIFLGALPFVCLFHNTTLRSCVGRFFCCRCRKPPNATNVYAPNGNQAISSPKPEIIITGEGGGGGAEIQRTEGV